MDDSYYYIDNMFMSYDMLSIAEKLKFGYSRVFTSRKNMEAITCFCCRKEKNNNRMLS